MNANVARGTLQSFLDDANPDILCLNETKTTLETITKKNLYKAIPDGYE